MLLLLFAVMMALCAFLAVYLIRPKFLVRFLQKISPSRHCPHCFEKMEKGSHFCAKCGAIIDNSSTCTAMEKCARCGEKILDVNQEFCPRCGSILKR